MGPSLPQQPQLEEDEREHSMDLQRRESACVQDNVERTEEAGKNKALTVF